jgi:hypothetical protein
MKKSLHISGVAGRLILPAILVLCAAAATAQMGGPVGQPLSNGNSNGSGNSLVGQWRGDYQGITITLVVQPNGQYSQLAQKGTLMTEQSGPYKLVAPNTLIFAVTDWQPRTQQIYHAVGTTRGYYTTERTARPPGGTDTYVFQGANTIILTDQVMHGSITMTRVP